MRTTKVSPEYINNQSTKWKSTFMEMVDEYWLTLCVLALINAGTVALNIYMEKTYFKKWRRELGISPKPKKSEFGPQLLFFSEVVPADIVDHRYFLIEGCSFIHKDPKPDKGRIRVT